MINLNPFKKKENDFKLDEHELPSMSNIENASNEPSDLNNNTTTDSTIQDNQINNDNLNTSMNDMSTSNPFNGINNIDTSGNDSLLANQSSNMNSFNDNSQASFSNPIEQQNTNIQTQSNNTDMNSQINKANIESMNSKMTLVDARLSNIEHKLEVLNNLILAEISEETKRKVNINSAMNNLKQQ